MGGRPPLNSALGDTMQTLRITVLHSTFISLVVGITGGLLLVAAWLVVEGWLWRRSPFVNPYASLVLAQMGAFVVAVGLWFLVSLPLFPLAQAPAASRAAYGVGLIVGAAAVRLLGLSRTRRLRHRDRVA
jgi:hypothetical protein